MAPSCGSVERKDVKTKFRLINYDGGLPLHPRAEAKGTLVLTKAGRWELHWGGRGLNQNLGRFCYGGILRFPLEVESTGTSSCHVVIRDSQDPSVAAGLDLPDTPASILEAALGLDYAARVAGFVGRSNPVSPVPGNAYVADELAKLAELRDSGVLNEEEFAAQRAKLLAG